MPHPRRLPLIAFALLILAVASLATLQYRWVEEVSDAREAQAQAQLREHLAQVTAALDSEITAAALFFESPADPTQTLGVWRSEAHWPDLISGVALARSTDQGWEADWVGEAPRADIGALLKPFMHEAPTRFGPQRMLDLQSLKREMSIGGEPALIQPLATIFDDHGRLRTTLAILRFDPEVVAKKMLPELLGQFLSADEREEYAFQLGGVAGGDSLGTDLFHYRGDCLMRHYQGAMLSPVSAAPQMTQMTQITWDRLRQAVGDCGRPDQAAAPGLLRLSVARQPAWIDIYASFRRRNLLISGLVLGVLCASLTALTIASMRARRLAKLQSVLAAGISHELRTPLASLRLVADLLKGSDGMENEEIRQLGEVVDAQALRLVHTVDQTIALSAARRVGRRNAERVSLSTIADCVLEGFADRLDRAGIAVRKSLDPELPEMIGDPELIERCAANLVENAIKYAASGKMLTLTTSTRRSAGMLFVELAVEDRGPGIPASERRAVFEAFYRGDTARQSRQPGSGLGLAIVSALAAGMEGKLDLESAEPTGCRFRLSFPAQKAA